MSGLITCGLGQNQTLISRGLGVGGLVVVLIGCVYNKTVNLSTTVSKSIGLDDFSKSIGLTTAWSKSVTIVSSFSKAVGLTSTFTKILKKCNGR